MITTYFTYINIICWVDYAAYFKFVVDKHIAVYKYKHLPIRMVYSHQNSSKSPIQYFKNCSENV